jgi:hypothetical protein
MRVLDCGIGQFLAERGGQEVICFGAGSYFEAMCHDIGGDIHIIAVLDNDPEKWGRVVSAGSVAAPLWSPRRAREIPGFDRSALLVTASAYAAIVDALNRDPMFDDVACYVYPLMKFKGLKPLGRMIQSAGRPLIPKVIHYGWFGGKPIPGHLLDIMDTWRRFCPDYEIVRWDEGNYDVKKNAYLREAYERKEWTFLNDYARIDIICQQGGIFLDTDVEALKSLDDLRYNAGFVGTEPIGGVNVGSGFGAARGFPAFCELLEAFDREYAQSEGVALKSNLGRETAFFCGKGFVPNGEYQVVADTAIFPFNVLSPKIRELGETVVTEATYCVHHFEGSWVKHS